MAAARLQELLIDIDERLSTGSGAGEPLLRAVAEWAYLHPRSALDPDDRYLDRETCLLVIDRALQALPSPGLRTELGAQAALKVYLLLGEPSDPETAEHKLLAAARASPPPHPATRAHLLLQASELARVRADYGAVREILDESSEILEAAHGYLEQQRSQLEPSDHGREELIASELPLIAAAKARTELKWGQLEIDLGRPDLAALHMIASQAPATISGDSMVREQRLHEAGFWVTVDAHQEAIRLCTLLLEDEDLEAALVPRIRDTLGVARFQLACEGTGSLGAARSEFELALASTTDAARRATYRFRLGEIAVEERDLDLADRELEAARLELAEVASLPTGLEAQIAYLGVRVSRLRGSRSHEDLQAHIAQLRRIVEESMEDFRALESVVGGLGYLRYPFRVEPIHEWIEAELEFDKGKAGCARALVPWIRAQMLGSLGRALGVREPTLAEVIEALPPDGILLAYLPGQRATLLLVLERGSDPEFHRLPGRWALVRRMETQSDRLAPRPGATRSDSKLEAEAAALGGMLLPAKVTERLHNGRRVVCVGTELLGRMPFEALQLPDRRWLGSAVAIEHWSSIPVAVELQRRLRAGRDVDRSGSIGFLAPRSPRGDLRGLEFTDEERKLMLSAWPELDSLVGEAASEPNLERLAAGSHSFALFLAHGIESPDDPFFTGIALAAGSGEDGDLWPHELRGLLRVPPYVVLGVCGAGFGAPRLGEDGANHLGGLWIERGAQSVVLSAFALERGATVHTMVELGRMLSVGSSLPEGMRAARSTAVEGRPVSLQPLLLQVVGWNP